MYLLVDTAGDLRSWFYVWHGRRACEYTLLAHRATGNTAVHMSESSIRRFAV